MTITSTSPMVVVANRLPFTVNRGKDGTLTRKQSAGGLVTAVAPVVVETGGLWVGWPGFHEENQLEYIPESDPDDKCPTAGLKSEQIIPVSVKEKLFSDYYNGCCNACFWPLFHSMPDRAVFEADKWEAYQEVNVHFAIQTMKAVRILKAKQPDKIPLVWIHDYQLMLAAITIRKACEEEGVDIKLAFFLHIPFPAWDIVRIFPWSEELLQGLLACDSVGFHIEDYCLNFLDCCQRQLGCRIDRERKEVLHNLRNVGIHELPISIPYERFRTLAVNAPVEVENKQEHQLVLGVDRLDYTKGIVNRVKAFEVLLDKYPEHKEHASLLQVAVPSRTDVKEYQELKEELDHHVGRINGKFSTLNWAPIKYIYGCVPQDKLAGFYRDSSVALVTPLRDGMNLVAKEFVACQTKEPGVLVLSPFAGAGKTMQQALLANPYEVNQFAKVIHQALTLPKNQRELRMKLLQKREKERDVNFWLKLFLKTVDCLADEGGTTSKIDFSDETFFDPLLGPYVKASTTLALLLDYDGTLVPIAPHPDLAQLPEETKKLLERLSHMPDVKIAVISGRSLDNVKKMVGIEGITYAGNHGFRILHPDGMMYSQAVPVEYERKLEVLKRKLKEEACHDGAWLEDKGPVVTFHYREAAKEKVDEITSKARKIFDETDLSISYSLMAYEARPKASFDKGQAAIDILRTLFGMDRSDISVIFAGDDATDEDAMKALKGIGITFRVSDSHNLETHATHRLPNTDAVYRLLKWVERTLSGRTVSETCRSRTSSFTGSLPRSSSFTAGEFSHNGRGSPGPRPLNKMLVNLASSEGEYMQIGKRASPPLSPSKSMDLSSYSTS